MVTRGFRLDLPTAITVITCEYQMMLPLAITTGARSLRKKAPVTITAGARSLTKDTPLAFTVLAWHRRSRTSTPLADNGNDANDYCHHRPNDVLWMFNYHRVCKALLSIDLEVAICSHSKIKCIPCAST